jgi:hypothetical protein
VCARASADDSIGPVRIVRFTAVGDDGKGQAAVAGHSSKEPRMGPLEFLVLEFPWESLRAESFGVLAEFGAGGPVVLVDSLTVTKSESGSVISRELADLPRPTGARPPALLNLIGAEDAEEVGRTLRPGTSALIVLVEHVWARDVADRAADAGGRLGASVRIDQGVAEQVAALAAIGK